MPSITSMNSDPEGKSNGSSANWLNDPLDFQLKRKNCMLSPCLQQTRKLTMTVEPPPKRAKLDHQQFYTVESMEKKINEVAVFLTDYKDAMRESSSRFIFLRIEQKMKKAQQIIEKVKSGITLNVGLCGPTAIGKSYISNCIATYDTDYFHKSAVMESFLPSGSFSELSAGHGGITFLPSNIEYSEQCKLERIIRNKEQEDNQEQSIESENEILINQATLNSSFLTDVKRHLKEANLEDSLGFNISAPFPYLKQFGIALKDIPGLSDGNEMVASEACRTAMALDVVLFVDGGKRGKQEFNTLNLIEDILDRPKNELPWLIAFNNEKNEEDYKGITDDYLKSEISSVFDKLSDYRYFKSLQGSRRGEIFKEMKNRCYGLSFIGFNSTTNIVKERLDQLGRHLDDIRRQKIHMILEEALYLLLSSAYEIRKDLNIVSKFNPNDLVNYEKYLDDSFKMNKKGKSSNWHMIVDSVLEEYQAQIENVDCEKNMRSTMRNIIPSSLYDAFVRSVLNEHLEVTRQHLVNFVIKVIPAANSEDLEEINQNSNYDPVSNKIGRVIDASKNLRSDMQKRRKKEEVKNIEKIQMAQQLYSNAISCLEEKKEELLSELVSTNIFADVKDAMLRNLPRDLFNSSTSLSKNEVSDVLTTGLKKLANIRKWSNKSLMLQGLITNQILLEECKKYLSSSHGMLFKNGIVKTTNIPNLKRRITLWFNEYKETKPERMSSENHSKIDWAEYIPSNYDDINVESENKRTQNAKKLAQKQNREFYDTVLPKGGVKSNFRNFEKKDVSFEVLSSDDEDVSKEDEEETIDRLIRIEHKKNNGSNTGFTISHYKNMFTDLIEVLQSEKCIFPICIPSYKRSEYFVRSALVARHKEEMENFPHLIYLFVEDNELEKYASLLSDIEDKLVYVTIPDGGRGVAFARSLIKMWVDEVSQRCLNEFGVRFDWWWMIDDDLQMARVFDNNVKTESMMRPCTIALALSSTQEMICSNSNVREYETVLVDENDGYIKDYETVLFELTKLGATERRIAQQFGQKEKFSKFIEQLKKNNQQEAIILLKSWKLIEHVDAGQFDTWFKNLIIKANELLQSNSKIVHISIASSTNNAIRRNYNLVVKGTHYRASTQRHACLLSYVPGLWGYNYLEWDQLLLSEEEVKQERKNHFEENSDDRKLRLKKICDHIAQSHSISDAKESYYEYRDNFLGEDKKLVELLLKDNRSGFQAFYFDIVWGAQRKGGCFQFRRGDEFSE